MTQPACVHRICFRALTAAVAMNKRVPAWFVLASFSLFSCSCLIYTWKDEPLQSIKSENRESAKISAVQTKNGEKIELNKEPAARFQADFVAGEKLSKDIAIEKSKIEKPKYLPSEYPFLLTTTDGKSYRVTLWAEVKDKIILYAYVPISIPLSDIDLVWIRKVNVLATLLYDIGVPLALFSAIILYRASHPD